MALLLYRSFVCVFLLSLGGSVVAEEGRGDDPLESFNRAMFHFNDATDRWVLKPVAQGYRAITPDPIEKGVARMFNNVGEVVNIVNDVFQGKIAQAGNDTGRLLVNSTVGVAGFFDIADRWGMRKSAAEDFGQTMAVWGVPQGAYVVLPFFGPSNFRDAPGQLVDSFLNPIGYIEHVPSRNQVYGADILSGRAELLEAEKLISGDKYSFVRDVYLQRREHLIKDGRVDDDFGASDYQDSDYPDSDYH